MKPWNALVRRAARLAGHSEVAQTVRSGAASGTLAVPEIVPLAREIAAALFCRGEHKPCGSCNQCRKVLEQNHPDVEYYGGDGSRRSFHG